jgi:hypothetical protein
MEQLVHLRLKSIYKAFQQSNPKGGKNRESASTRAVAAAAAAACGGAKETTSGKDKKLEKNEKTFSARQAEADMAAASLLAELEEEEQVQKKKSSKKKKKKALKKKQQEDDAVVEEGDEKQSKEDSSKDEEPEVIMEEEETTPRKLDEPMEEEELPTPPPEEEKMDPDEVRLYEMVADSDGDGIEALLAEMKGVPGKAALRKNAKKALKRLREDRVREEEEAAAAAERKANEEAEAAAAAAIAKESSSYKPPEPLLTLVSRNVHSSAKAECVLHMSPQVVGWVIGKGGQRIRDLMDESGSKVWIDQDTMGTNDSRVVYVSGSTKAVDDAVRRIKDLVAKAPVGGATTGTSSTITSQNPNKIPPSSPEAKAMEAPSIPSRPSPARVRAKSASKDKDWAIHEITCEARFVPLLIGRRGWTIKHIQDESGARVDIDQSVTPRKIKISGKKDSVATAIRMVKDVLSYPHAQLDKSGTAIAAAAAAAAAAAKPPSGAAKFTPQINVSADELASLEAERNLSNHSPPPSSLIMTGDARTISASSSLSSTPEPSMTSTSKSSSYKHPLSSADLISPNFAAVAGAPYLQASLQSDLPLQPREQPPIGMASGPSIGAVGSATGLSQPQQDPRFMNQPPSQVGGLPFSQALQQGGGMSFGSAQQQHVQGLHRASTAPIGNVGAPGYGQQQQQQQQQQEPLGGLFGQQQQQQQQQQPIGGQSFLRDALMGSNLQDQQLLHDTQTPMGQASMQQQQQAAPMPSFPTDSYQPNAHLLFQKPQNQMPSVNVNETETFDLFGRSRNISGGMQNQNNNVNPPSSYLFQGGQGPPHRQNSDSQIHPNPLYAESQLRRNSTGGAPSIPLKRGGSMPADSDIVDSLFAVGGNEQSLLSGIQGLDLNNNGVGGGAGAGWWVNDNANNAGGLPGAVQQANSGLNGGMLNGSQQHPGQQQSRFDWG